MKSLFPRRFAAILGAALALSGCGGAPLAGQGSDCKAQTDCLSSSTLTCVSVTGDHAFMTCEIVCSKDSDCPNSQPCSSFNDDSTLPKTCQVNPG